VINIALSPGNIQGSTLYYLRETSSDQHCIISGKHPVINIVLSPGNIQGSTLHYLREISSDQHCIISGKHPGINIVLSPGDIQGSTLYYLRETSRDQHCINEQTLPQLYIRQLPLCISAHLWTFWGYQHWVELRSISVNKHNRQTSYDCVTSI
jgi:ribosomal protein L19